MELEATALRKISASLESSKLTCHVPECLRGDSCALASRECLNSLLQICVSFTWQRKGACANKWLEINGWRLLWWVYHGKERTALFVFIIAPCALFITLRHVSWSPFVLSIFLLKELSLLLVPVLPVFCAGICLFLELVGLFKQLIQCNWGTKD